MTSYVEGFAVDLADVMFNQLLQVSVQAALRWFPPHHAHAPRAHAQWPTNATFNYDFAYTLYLTRIGV
jgi:hypothetical protein